MINSRRKGANGERQWRDVLREHGYNARRGAQYSGHSEAPDVVSDDGIHWEVKCVEKLNLRKAMEQAIRDSKRIKYPAVAHKVNNGPWYVTMEASDFFNCKEGRSIRSKPLDCEGVAAGGKGKADAR